MMRADLQVMKTDSLINAPTQHDYLKTVFFLDLTLDCNGRCYVMLKSIPCLDTQIYQSISLQFLKSLMFQSTADKVLRLNAFKMNIRKK